MSANTYSAINMPGKSDDTITEIPIYKLFTRDGGLTNTPDVDILVDIDEIQRDIVKVESKYRLS